MPAAELVAVLGADSPIGLTVVRELGAHGVPVFALGKSDDCIARWSRHTTRFAAVERSVETWLPAFVRDEGITALMAISEGDLVQLSELASRLDCKVLVPRREKLDIVLDKRRTLEIAQRIGIAVPDSWQPIESEDFSARANTMAFPVAIKWPDPADVAALLAAAGLPLEKVEYARSPAELLGILSRFDALCVWPLVQTWCPGEGLGQMLHMANDVATLRFQHRRLREWPVSGGVSTLCESVPLDRHREQMALSEALLREIGWEGPAMVEYRHDPATGEFRLMEINGRFWGSIPLASHCGAEFAWETYRQFARGDASPAPAAYQPLKARYAVPDAKHLAARLRDRSLPLARRVAFAMRFAFEFLDPKMRYYVWRWSDPMPFFGDLIGAVRRRTR